MMTSSIVAMRVFYRVLHGLESTIFLFGAILRIKDGIVTSCKIVQFDSQKSCHRRMVFAAWFGYTLTMQNNASVEKSPATKGQKIAAIASIAVFFIVLVLLTVFVGGPIIKTLGDPASRNNFV